MSQVTRKKTWFNYFGIIFTDKIGLYFHKSGGEMTITTTKSYSGADPVFIADMKKGRDDLNQVDIINGLQKDAI